MGGLSSEREISLSTGNEVLKALKRKGLDGIAIDVDKHVAQKLADEKIDVAFIALHGAYGEDGAIQGMLECAGIPYTGSGVLGSAVAYDKVISKRIFKDRNIPTAEYQVFYKNEPDKNKRTIGLPCVVKPSNQGSSIGVSIVREEEDFAEALELAFQYSSEVIVEDFIDGKLIAIGMDQDAPMPIVHIKPESGFYDYEAKYTAGKTEYICPADIEEEIQQRCRQAAVMTFQALKGRGLPRVDAILDKDGTPYILEMNSVPGLTPTSLLPMAAKMAGMEFDDLIIRILQLASTDYRK